MAPAPYSKAKQAIDLDEEVRENKFIELELDEEPEKTITNEDVLSDDERRLF